VVRREDRLDASGALTITAHPRLLKILVKMASNFYSSESLVFYSIVYLYLFGSQEVDGFVPTGIMTNRRRSDGRYIKPHHLTPNFSCSRSTRDRPWYKSLHVTIAVPVGYPIILGRLGR
jgi:hypothetical protein